MDAFCHSIAKTIGVLCIFGLMKRLTLMCLILVVLLPACEKERGERFYALVRVTDGDTIVLEDGSEDGLRIRFIGIDAPESRDYMGRKEEPYGKEATAALEQLVQGMQVRLEFDRDRLDPYGRTLAYVYTRNGDFLNDHMLRMGYAECMPIEPNVRYREQFDASERHAKEHKLGMWQ